MNFDTLLNKDALFDYVNSNNGSHFYWLVSFYHEIFSTDQTLPFEGGIYFWGLKTEIQIPLIPLLKQVNIHTDPNFAFK